MNKFEGLGVVRLSSESEIYELNSGRRNYLKQKDSNRDTWVTDKDTLR